MKHLFMQWWAVFLTASLGGYYLYKQHPSLAAQMNTSLLETTWLRWVLYGLLILVAVLQFNTPTRRLVKIIGAIFLTLAAYCSSGLFIQQGFVGYSVYFISISVSSALLWFVLHYKSIGWKMVVILAIAVHMGVRLLGFN
ncbi:hypothetical protein MKY84_09475 [Chryseomicrobium sp. FSL W7-1435]|uniref:hypothetical protein n=1 Tax=Chryseomicrobium sp. FSL W7-1435 TaxID=2921704 RepID=UPI00315B00A2